MQRHFKITVDGKAYDVIVEDMAEPSARTIPQPGDMLPPRPAPAAAPAAIVAPPPAAPTPPPSGAPAAAAGPGDEVAPLGGVVASIEVAVGQQVANGDKIAVIEAMKMKTQVFAHRTGAVQAIAVKPGDGVEQGQVLITIA